MTNQPSSENEVTQPEPGDSTDGPCAGKFLKSKREEINMTQQEVATKLNLNIDYIVAIESDDYEKISGKSYIYGYIRSYAKLLKLSESEILELCKDEGRQKSNIVPDYMERKTAFTSESFLSKYWLYLFIVITSLLLATWWLIRNM